MFHGSEPLSNDAAWTIFGPPFAARSIFCAELLPELIRLDDWGYPILDEASVPDELLGLARKAVDACPTLALLLDDN